tara:strand:+ start:145 stop:618 length:474 start_codon:yes stop_codon:yes gene_type:complete
MVTAFLHSKMQLNYATCVALSGRGVLLRGFSGSGKSDLALRLINEGATLVADDQVLCRREGSRLYASAPNATRGLLEVRGIGPIRTSYIPRAKICLVVDLVAMNSIQRFPMSRTCEIVGVEILLIELTAFEVSATAKLKLALESVTSGTQFGNNMLS